VQDGLDEVMLTSMGDQFGAAFDQQARRKWIKAPSSKRAQFLSLQQKKKRHQDVALKAYIYNETSQYYKSTWSDGYSGCRHSLQYLAAMRRHDATAVRLCPLHKNFIDDVMWC
jgi:hypothetical protein